MITVRTQDKMTLVKVDVIEIDQNIITALIADCEGTLGVYCSHERALEVLDKLERHIECQGRPAVPVVFHMPER